MTTWTHRFMVVPAANVATARQLALDLAEPPAADNMWTVGLSPNGLAPATHYISSGLIDIQFAALLGAAASTYAVDQAMGGSVSLADIQALYAAAPLGTYIRSDAEGKEHECIAALGLQLLTAVD